MTKFADRDDAGHQLGRYLIDRLGFLVPDAPGEPDDGSPAAHAQRPPGALRPLVLALPRGGVPVATHVAAALDGDLDLVVACKIRAPEQPEYGIGALAEDGPPVFDGSALTTLGLTEGDLMGAVERERAETKRRVQRYRKGRAVEAKGRMVIVVDDGLATGVTARATLRWLRDHEPAYLVMAAPVGSRRAHAAVAEDADAVVCLQEPEDFRAVGEWYEDFRQLTDEDVDETLRRFST
ncbi:hypothetical protein LWF15_26755 [Kineosporia rhizophila]|uniref:phosphoribosyltransferase n=1 Tax=Kineosporia TaxID=49184 RepID=UPI001E440470|nr:MULTISPECIES: phosphoribosyltransferase family protein [Kineosporia]MCE0539106.1 hypothetical protein [Kineosporia rhizophila]GLY18133.1 phosphoribosyltransferase [Kineosporia sp. NBRC 101677]